jgi:hypothetical protein
LAVTFVIGLSLEVAGAAFLAAELLTLDPAVLAARGNTYPQSGEPHLEAQVPAARTFVGLGLLLVGFGVQIGGYAFGEGPAWLMLLSLAVVVGGFLLGRRVSDQVLTPWLYRRAVRFRESQETNSPR